MRQGDHAFLWEHAIFRYLPSRNPSTDQDEILRDWLHYRDYAMCQKWLESVGGDSPTDRWNITSTFLLYLTLLYFTLPFFYYCMPLQPKRLNRFARTIAQTMRFAVRKCLLGVALIRNYIWGSKHIENPKFWKRDAKFTAKSIQSNDFWTVRDGRKLSTDAL